MQLPLILRSIIPYFRSMADSGTPPDVGVLVDGATTIAATDRDGFLYSRNALVQSQAVHAFAAPAVGVQATCGIAALGAHGNNASVLVATYGDTVAAVPATIVIRNGASGAGAIVWQMTLGPIAVNDSKTVVVSWPFGLGPFSTFGNALTAEFLAAPAATGYQSIALTGYRSRS